MTLSHSLKKEITEYYGDSMGGNQLYINTIYKPNANRPAQKQNIFQTELMVEIYSKSLVRAIGKVLLIKCS